jgi:hypothetical protein
MQLWQQREQLAVAAAPRGLLGVLLLLWLAAWGSSISQGCCSQGLDRAAPWVFPDCGCQCRVALRE